VYRPVESARASKIGPTGECKIAHQRFTFSVVCASERQHRQDSPLYNQRDRATMQKKNSSQIGIAAPAAPLRDGTPCPHLPNPYDVDSRRYASRRASMPPKWNLFCELQLPC